jgi:hypothetical protein
MAAYAISCVLLAFIAALRPSGWRVVGYSVAGAVGIYGLASLVFPFDASAADAPWAILALAWAAGFAALTYVEVRRSRPAETGNLEEGAVTGAG